MSEAIWCVSCYGRCAGDVPPQSLRVASRQRRRGRPPPVPSAGLLATVGDYAVTSGSRQLGRCRQRPPASSVWLRRSSSSFQTLPGRLGGIEQPRARRRTLTQRGSECGR
jgi:hypothetical protein